MTLHPLCRSFFIGISLVALTVSSVSAQNREGMVDRLDQLERDFQMLQRNYYRDGSPAAETPVKTNVPAAGAARFEVQINELQVQLRELRGQIEEMEFQQRRLSEKFELLENDMDSRMELLEKQAAAAPPVIGDTPLDQTESTESEVEVPASDVENPRSPKPDARFDNAKEHYNAAFKELNAAKYEKSATLFSEFISLYPDDSLIGNAYYWLGETHYVRKDYAEAANQFRLGFEKMPEGPKAADNLLKLAMSLSAIERVEESCVVLKQLVKKYGGASDAVDRKAKKERAKLKCK